MRTMGFLVAAMLVSGSGGAEAQSPVAPAETRATMDETFAALLRLQPYLVSSEQFARADSRDAIWKALGVLQGVSHSLPQKAYLNDPGLALTASWFGGYLDQAQKSFLAKDLEHARLHLQTATGLCLDCHTRLKEQTSFSDVNREVDSFSLPPLAKAEYLAATRQYEGALAVYQQVVSETPKGEKALLDYQRALRHALIILVEVKSEPAATLALLAPLAQRPDLPSELSASIDNWRQDTDAWKADKFNPLKATTAQLVQHARALIGDRRSGLPDAAQDADDLRLMRATSELRKVVQRSESSTGRGEALYLLGYCYSKLGEPSLGALDAFYWEDCVREFPHTPTAQRCFQRLFNRTYQGLETTEPSVAQYQLDSLEELRLLAH